MDSQHWQTVKTLFDELVELPGDVQAERLATLGAADPELHHSVAALLAADGQADTRLGEVDAAFLQPPPERPDSAPPPDPFGLSGRRLAHFHVVEPLGAGGMGVVYRAEDTRLNRMVALKIPHPEYRLDAAAKQRFLHEARSTAALDHPNLCGIYEVGESDEGHPFLAMPLYPGETLKQRLARDAPLPVDEAVEIGRQVAEGLAAAHDAGIVHRDVKPGNIMLLPNGAVKVLDFGLAKVRDLTLTGSRTWLGTVAYMAPEQIRQAPVDGRADLWALGVVLYEMLTGRRPFEGEHDVSVAHGIVHEEPLRPSILRGGLPSSLEGLLVTLLRKEPARRPASAQQLAADLAVIQQGRTLPLRRRLRQRWATATGWQRHPAWRTATGVLITATLAVAVGGHLTTRPSEGPAPHIAPTDGSVAVLPFVNLSGDPQHEFLSDGITEELTNHLTRVEGLRVAAQTSSFRFKGGNVDVREVGHALSVASVLQGSVRRDGQRVRITAQLIDASNGFQLWSETYDRELSDIFAVQDEISQAIVSVLRIRLTRPVATRLPSTSSPEAYEAYLKGRYFWNRRTAETLVRATEYFQQAIALDADFAEAHSGLADVEIAPRAGRPAERFANAKLAAARALALDSLLPEAHISMSWIKLWYDRDQASAEWHIRRAVELDPNSIWAVARYAAFLAATGRVEESLPLIRRAHQFDPLSYTHATYVGTHYLWLRRESEAIPYFRKSLELNPDFFMAHWGLGRAYLRQGRYQDALAELAYEGGDYTGLNRPGLLGHAHALAGNEAEARRILSELREQAGRGDYVPPVALAIIHIGLGEKAQALDWLERVEADAGARIFLADPIFDPIRSEPRFQGLLKRLGLEYTALPSRPADG
ncbi:serine/threonine-protein kinase [soil metagenome]